MRIRVTTRANLFEKRKQEHIERGYRIEGERPNPVNGLCSFIAVRELPDTPQTRHLSPRLASVETWPLGQESAALQSGLPPDDGVQPAP